MAAFMYGIKPLYVCMKISLHCTEVKPSALKIYPSNWEEGNTKFSVFKQAYIIEESIYNIVFVISAYECELRLTLVPIQYLSLLYYPNHTTLWFLDKNFHYE